MTITAHVIAGTLLAELAADRTVEALLVPFGEVGSTNLGRFSIDRGRVEIPADLSILNVNEDHDQVQPRGRMLMATEQADGIHTRFQIGQGPECDALVARIAAARAAGRPLAVSVELANAVIRAGKLVAGKLAGAAIVERGAFPSATLLAAAADTPADPAPAGPADPAPFTPDESGNITVPATTMPATVTVTAGDGTTTFAPNDTEGDTTVTVPATVTASSRTNSTKPKGVTLQEAFGILGRARSGTASPEELKALTAGTQAGNGASLFAALNGVPYDGAANTPGAIDQAQWIGQLYEGVAYVQKYAPLLNSKPLTSKKLHGWRWKVKPTGGTWAGNLAAVPTNTPEIEPYDDEAMMFAGGHKLARELQDFRTFGSGGDFIESYWSAMAESYARWEDKEVALASLLAEATELEADNPAGLDIGPGFSALVDGAVAVIDADALPTFGIVASSLYKPMLKTPKNNVLGYLAAALQLDTGDLAGFKLVSAPDAELGGANIVVGSSSAATFRNLGGVPIRANADDLVNGGSDTGLYGYAGVQTELPGAIVKVKPYTP